MSVEVLQGRRCLWCKGKITFETTRMAPVRKLYCSKKCRQTAFRFRRVAVLEDLHDTPKRLAYADPPYPGTSKKYYGDEPTYKGEVDHKALVSRLAKYDGWALSTSRHALAAVLPMCPKGAVVCPWVKTHPAPKARGPSNIHEYLIVFPGRRRLPGVPDAFVGAVAKGGDSDLIGRKPIKFVAWMFSLLGASSVDQLDDLFPGSGVVGRCWEEFRRSVRQGRRSPRAVKDSRKRIPATAGPGDGKGGYKDTRRKKGRP